MPVNNAALAARRRKTMDQLRATVGSQLAAKFRSLDDYSDPERFAALVAPIVLAGQGRAVSTQIAYLQTVIGTTLDYDRAALLDKAAIDLTQPFIAFANALSSDLELAEAVEAGALRAEGAGESAVTWAERAANTAADRHVKGWERIPEGGACDWCIQVAGQTYHSADSAAFGHLRCSCDVSPLI